jgi:RHS repeat-associated protein
MNFMQSSDFFRVVGVGFFPRLLFLTILAQPGATAAPASIEGRIYQGPAYDTLHISVNGVATSMDALGLDCTSGGVFGAECLMTPGVTYSGTLSRTVPTFFCRMSIGAINLPGCYVASGGCPVTNVRDLTIPFSIGIFPQEILFAWDFPKDGFQALPADGHSSVRGSVVGSPGTLSWEFVGDDLGCALAGDTTGVTVMAGTKTGTVMVRATRNGGSCHEIPLDLVDCQACENGNCGTGGVSVKNSSVDVKVNLGWAVLGNTAGYLQIKESFPTNTIATPRALRYNFRRADVVVLTNSQGLYQVKAPQVLANVVTNSGCSYTIQLFNPTNIIGHNGGGYQLTNSPYRTLTIENPGADTNSVHVTDSAGSSVYDYTWATNGWLLASGGGLRNELRTTVLSASNTISTITSTVWTGSEPPAETKVEVWQTIPGIGVRLTSEVFGTGSAARTNAYTYTAAGYLEQFNRWDGYWEYYRYDGYNRPTNIFSAFGTQGVTTDAALCRLIDQSYSGSVISGSGDDGTRYFNTPRRTIEYLQGWEVARKYFVGLAAERREIQCVAAGAAWNDSNNLVTTFKVFTNGLHLNEPWLVIRPDHTADLFEYGNVGACTTNVLSSGHLDATESIIDAGTRTTNVVGAAGELLDKKVIDVQSGILLDWQMYAYDFRGRLTDTYFIDGTSFHTSYNCCAADSQTDRDGTVTSFTHDALKRLLTTTVNGITSSNVYDPAGNNLAVVRFGTNGSAITLNQAAFDDAGRQTSSADPLSHTTLYTNYLAADGSLVKKTTLPDESTRIETFNCDGSLQSLTGTAVYPARYEYGAETDGAYAKEIKLNADGSDTSEWTKTYSDCAGRQHKTLYASASGSPFSISRFNAFGQLTNQVDPDGVSMLYCYGLQGERTYSVLDSNRNYTIDWSGPDRITLVTNDVVTENGVDLRRTTTGVWTGAGDTGTVVSTAETSTDGLSVWNTIWNNGEPVTTRTDTASDPAHGYRVVTTTAPDGSTTTATNQYGRLVSVTRKDASGSQIGQTLYGFDTHGRRSTETDVRNGTTTFFFNDGDQISGIVTPSADGIQPGQVTTNYFDDRGRIWRTTLPDGTSVTNEFWPTGELKKNYGSRVYPTESGIDAQGRPHTLTTWQDFAGRTGSATTTWNYDGYRGLLTNKVYNGGAAGPVYGYTPGARLQSRLWARGTTTSTSYNDAGDLSGASYDDGSTPALAYGQDRRGRQRTITQGAVTTTRALDDAGNLLSESYSGGPLDGVTVTNRYDQFLRRTNLSVLYQQSTLQTINFSYDSASRLKTVSSGTSSAGYSYVANSPLLGQIAFTNNGALRMTTTNQHDHLNRLTAVNSTIGSFAIGYSYGYNLANQRTNVTLADNSHWVYGQDYLGQVTSGKRYWPDETPVAGQQFEYSFDDIGNRNTASFGGDNAGQNLWTAYYTNNLLNQITSRTVPGFVSVIGSANSNATVTLWADSGSYAPTFRKGEYFSGQVPANSETGAIWLTITNLAVLQQGTNADVVSSVTGNALLPRNPELFGYDLDGNLTNDGRWAITWDAENRATSFTSLASTPAASRRKVDCTYDYVGRRIQKIVSAWNGTAYVPQYTNRLVYDGWNLIAVLDGAGTNLLQSYLWGADLSGTMQGAGGVGGLLAISDYRPGTAGTYFPAYDGNGNVMAVVSAADGSIAAQYAYGPFGEMIRATGPLAKANPFRFSTKYQDDELDLLYYGYRYYNQNTGRWLSRDPRAELLFETHRQFKAELARPNAGTQAGDGNDYCFAQNSALTRIDPQGLSAADVRSIQGWSITAFFELCDNCKRCDNSWIPFINNDLQIAFGAPYLGCGDQALYVQNRLFNALNGSDARRWTTDIPRIWKPGPHQFLVLVSSDPSDPTIHVDPYSGEITMYYPIDTSSRPFKQRIDTISLKCKPRSATYSSAVNYLGSYFP